MASKQQAIGTTLCEELQASNCIYKSQGTHWATPGMAGKTADQHCLEVNVA